MSRSDRSPPRRTGHGPPQHAGPNERRTRPGTCPFCGACIAPVDVIGEDERGGDQRIYAECPDCRNVVRAE